MRWSNLTTTNLFRGLAGAFCQRGRTAAGGARGNGGRGARRPSPGALSTDAPIVGHQLTTLEDGAPVSWAVVEQQLSRDDAGYPFLELVAERDYAEVESLPDHELEHALDQEREDSATTAAVLARATDAGLAIELVGLEAGEAPEWDEASSYLESLILKRSRTT